MLRRNLLSTAGMLGLLAGCQTMGQQGSGVLNPQLKNGLIAAQLVISSLEKIITNISSPPLSLLNIATAAEAMRVLQTADIGVTAMLNGTTPPASASTLQQINGWIDYAISAAAPVLNSVLPGAAPIIVALQAVDALLPVIEGAIVAFMPVPAMQARARNRVHAARMASPQANWTPEQAQMYLHQYLNRSR